MSGPKVTALLDGQQADGGFGGDPYRKWTGAHWRLVSLAELGVPPGDPRVVRAVDHVLSWLVPGDFRDGKFFNYRPGRGPRIVNGLPRVHASVSGNALGACCRLGGASDPRARVLTDSLLSWQWPDGGWNCDAKASGRRSSFHESLATAWGLYEYGVATGDGRAKAAASRTAELFLAHRLLYRSGTQELINRRWLELRYPSYWHYEIVPALVFISRMGLAGDPRAAPALDELERRRGPDGRWAADGRWWRAPGGRGGSTEAVDWGQPGEPNEMITLNALRILRAANRYRPGPVRR